MAPDEFTEILIKVNIEKSDEALEIAEYSLSKNKLMTALNRIYYAIFYTTTALAQKHDFRTSKHITLFQWFNKKFIYEEKIFDENLSKIYKKAFQFRQKGDYDFYYKPDLEETKKLMSDAKIFIETVRKSFL